MVRVKSRYLLCEINVSDRSRLLFLNDGAIAAAVKEAVSRIHVKYLNTQTGMVFLRFPKRSYKLLWSALPFITSIETRYQKIQCFLNCLHVGGTIRTCQKFLVRYNTRQLYRMLPDCKNEEEEKQIRRAILSCSIIQGAFEDEPENDDDEDEV
ncbi:ribonuclease P/MRP protein subunit POP5 isoform X2 [Syngnathoides biaculeatus]|uniref:ribonuclease P/MRP protein subunit POP5 isoform X2 n=1 Tax=Syngnathoides biaculeatus TaxID=300417 RepID=UPI002ADD629C|nr:ribonuclease P/MRP protein subunit POP5 isoform X2 [Syngnathoides biaculeatus]